SSRRRHTRFSRDWSSDVCSSDLFVARIDFDRKAPIAESEHEIRILAPSEREARIGDRAVHIFYVGREVLKARFRGPPAAEIEAAFDADERHRSNAAFRFSNDATANDRVCLDLGDLNAEGSRELAAL